MLKQRMDELKPGVNASYVGVFFVVVVVMGGLIGNWLDQRFDKSPLFALLGVALGLAGGIREMLKALKENTPPPRPRWSVPAGPPAEGQDKTPDSGAGLPEPGRNPAEDSSSEGDDAQDDEWKSRSRASGDDDD